MDVASPTDRECLIAAILAAGGVDTSRSSTYMFERFQEILKEVRKSGGTGKMWMDAYGG